VAAFDSEFEGFWTDKSDWAVRLEELSSDLSISPEENELLRQFIKSGYVVIPAAVSHTLCDFLREEIINVNRKSEFYICRTKRQSYSYATREATADKAFRLIDFHVNSQKAQLPGLLWRTSLRGVVNFYTIQEVTVFPTIYLVKSTKVGIRIGTERTPGGFLYNHSSRKSVSISLMKRYSTQRKVTL